MLQIKPITNKKTWENFLLKQDPYPFFQSWNWGEVQKKNNTEIFRLGLFDNTVLVGVCLVVVIYAKRGTYVHLRHGPVLSFENHTHVDFFLEYIKALGKKKHASILRISPLIPKEIVDKALFDKQGCIDAPIHNMDAEVCWVLDITKPEEVIRHEMRKSHRYLIRKATQMTDGIKIIKTAKPEDIHTFLPLYKGLSERKHFVPHKGIQEEFAVFAKDNQSELFLAEYNGNIISGALIDYVGNMAIYRHGANDDVYRNLSASYVILWEAILEAKKRGLKIFNFWGIAPTESKTHPWYGLSLFKMGFGGERREYMHAKDIPLSPLYWFTYVVEWITKKKKGY